MQIVINSTDSLNQHAVRVAEHTKLSPNALKTAIAKAYGYQHITAFTQALTPDASAQSPAPVAIPNALKQLKLWLEDNVSMGTDIHFDNEGDITSEDALPALETLIAQSTPLDMQEIEKMQDDLNRFDAKASCMASAEASDVSELSMTHWENAEDALASEATTIANHQSLAHALTLLRQHGLDDLAQSITSLTVTAKDLAFLKATV